MNVYLISGLGADKRIFGKLKFAENIVINHVDWIIPKPKESLVSYAHRLSEIIDTSQPFAIIGVSFGGMLAVEIAKLLSPAITIIISSTLKSNHLPQTYQVAGALNLLRFIPAGFLKTSNQLTQNYYFGVKTAEEKKLLNQIIKDTDTHFLKWAIGAILTWKNEIKPERLFHIHGTKDKILYTKKYLPDFLIQDGTHFMVYQNADEISALVGRILQETIEY
jgi:hypothetical protein